MDKLPVKKLPRSLAVILSLLILAAIGLVDYQADFLVGYDLSLSTFYLLAISFALWNVGEKFAVMVSIMSVMCALGGDMAAGEINPNKLVVAWNSVLLLASYWFVIWLLSRLKTFSRSLEAGLRERSATLAAEVRERKRLEQEIFSITERERQRMGRELHDRLCQHLTATALAGQVLAEKLAERALPEVEDSKHLVELVEQGIVIARNLARGLFPFEIEAAGLVSALNELAESTTGNTVITCHIEAENSDLIHDPVTATHLYRIAQEAVTNAVKHGGAGHIAITLSEIEGGARLTVKDDGGGIKDPLQGRTGMGLQIMRHRAALIGGEFEIQSDSSGTTIFCSIPTERPVQTAPAQ